MEIATNMVQTMGTETVAVAAGGQVNTGSPSPDGAFALFFEQLLGELSGVMPEIKLDAASEKGSSLIQEKPGREEEATTEKEGTVSVTIPVELQAALAMQMGIKPQPTVTDQQVVESVNPPAQVPASIEPATMARVNPSGMTAIGPAKLPETAVAVGINGKDTLPAEPQKGNSVNSLSSGAELPASSSATPEPDAQVEVKVLREPRLAEALPVQAAVAQTAKEQNAPAQEMAEPPEMVKTAEPTAVKASSGIPGETVQMKPTVADRHVQKDQREENAPEAAVISRSSTEKAVVKEAASGQSEGGEQKEQQEQPVTKGKVALSPAPIHAEAPRAFESLKSSPAAVPAENPPPPEHEHILAQVREKISVHSTASGNGEISLKLHPEELGELKIMLKMNDQRLKVEIVAQNQAVRDVLMQNLDGLRESLSRQNISVDRFDVTTGGGSQQEFPEGRQAARDRFMQQSQTMKVSLPEQEQKMAANVWKPRENSLVDVRF